MGCTIYSPYEAVSLTYMFLTYDNEIKDAMDFRKGIVYGEKRR